jgi:hypothetical protein
MFRTLLVALTFAANAALSSSEYEQHGHRGYGGYYGRPYYGYGYYPAPIYRPVYPVYGGYGCGGYGYPVYGSGLSFGIRF